MFNHIRKVPYVVGDGKGGISYFAGGFSNQFGMETQVIAAICKLPALRCLSGSLELVERVYTNCTAIDAVLSFSAIALAMKVPRIADNKSQQVAVVIWGVVLLGTYSFLLSVFRVKNGGYPFFLPPF
jgi:oligosaccharyltransferase complex subunit gamma